LVTSSETMKIERINFQKLLEKFASRRDIDPELRRDIGSAMAETEVLSAWDQTLQVLRKLEARGLLETLGNVVRNGNLYLRFKDVRTGDVISFMKPPTEKIEVTPSLPPGLLRREDATRIESLFTSIATCRSEDELGSVLAGMLSTIRQMVSADYVAVHFIDDDIRAIFEKLADGSPEPRGRFAPSLVDRWVVEDGSCLHAPNIRSDATLNTYSDGVFASVAVVPLRCKGRTYGVLEVWSRLENHLTRDDLGFICLLAMLAAGLIKNAEDLESLIFRDPLTQVYNRGYLEDQLEREIERYKRTNEPVAFLMIDVDNFKQVNSRFGHPVGDLVLSTLGQLLGDKVRQIDVVARYGGDEFGIILPDTIKEHAYLTAERLRSVVGEHDFALTCPSLEDTSITISIGGAICPDDAMTKDELITKADRALAEAERAGKNRVVFISDIERGNS